jgi:hypothetical protein
VDSIKDDRQSHPLDYITQDAIEDLWGIGYTIVKRAGGDPFNVPLGMVPHKRWYQWWHLVHDKPHFEASGWVPVSASRHDGYFMPFGHAGNIEVEGCGLFEMSKIEVEQKLAANALAAHKQVSDLTEKTGAEFSGTVRVGDFSAGVGDPNVAQHIVDDTKTIATTVGIPKDMFWHMGAIFAERDRLEAEVVQRDRTLKPGDIADKFYAAIDADKAAPWWPTLRAILLPIAVANVREKLHSREPTDAEVRDLNQAAREKAGLKSGEDEGEEL